MIFLSKDKYETYLKFNYKKIKKSIKIFIWHTGWWKSNIIVNRLIFVELWNKSVGPHLYFTFLSPTRDQYKILGLRAVFWIIEIIYLYMRGGKSISSGAVKRKIAVGLLLRREILGDIADERKCECFLKCLHTLIEYDS